MDTLPRLAILGAGGLIGHALATALLDRGFPVVALARRFTPAGRAALGAAAVETRLVDLDPAALAHRLAGSDIVLNCIGVLQDAGGGGTHEAHDGFAARLLAALPGTALLVHVSIPGAAEGDRTPFSRSKREAERLIRASGRPHVILRPGFVLAPAAFGGSALMRALAALPVALPAREAGAPFAATALADLVDTVDRVARRWAAGERSFAATWDVMEARPGTTGALIEALRRHAGGPRPVLRLPAWTLRAGALAGDLAARLGWRPPIRSTPLLELRRGVTGDPGPWTAATGIAPRDLAGALAGVPATVQERWFARLYLLKPLVLASLVAFWVLSGLIALTVAFEPARGILLAHGVPERLATLGTVASSLVDIGVGVLIAHRRTCAAGLAAGVAVSLGYMVVAALFMPELWIEPLGSLVKTGPAIVLMGVALAILDER